VSISALNSLLAAKKALDIGTAKMPKAMKS
jgi:hypothetical protein